MKQITKFKACDGREFEDSSQCEAHEKLLQQIEIATRPLGKKPTDKKPANDGCSFSNGGGFLQHDTTTVEMVKDALIDLADVPDYVKEAARHVPAQNSIIGRYLDDGHSPLYGPWIRLMCIDSYGREWGQPYYAKHPEDGKPNRLN